MASGFGLGATVCQGRSNPLILEIYVAKGYPLKSRYLPNLNTSSFSKPQQPKYYKYFVTSIWHKESHFQRLNSIKIHLLFFEQEHR